MDDEDPVALGVGPDIADPGLLEAALQAGTLQTALESVQSHVQGFGATLLSNAAMANGASEKRDMKCSMAA